MSAQPKRAYYSASAAAAYLGVSPTTVLKALRCTDPSSYPPPLEYDGRHGPAGKFQISESQLDEWSRSLRTFG